MEHYITGLSKGANGSLIVSCTRVVGSNGDLSESEYALVSCGHYGEIDPRVDQIQKRSGLRFVGAIATPMRINSAQHYTDIITNATKHFPRP